MPRTPSSVNFLGPLSAPLNFQRKLEKVCPGTLGSLLESENEVTLSCPTLCDGMKCSPPGFSVHGVSQARIMEWVATTKGREFD